LFLLLFFFFLYFLWFVLVEKPFQSIVSIRFEYRIDSNVWRSTFSLRNSRSKIVIMLNEVEKCKTESTASVFHSRDQVYKRSGKCGM